MLHASIVAVNSDCLSTLNGKPAVSRISIFRPGTARKFFAKLRIDSNIDRAPKSASALLIEGMPMVATIVCCCPVVSMCGTFTELTAVFNNSALAVKFCRICKLPPKFTTAINASGLLLLSMNLVAAFRACIWSPISIDDVSKNRIR